MTAIADILETGNLASDAIRPLIFERGCADRHHVSSNLLVARGQSHFGTKEGIAVRHLISGDRNRAPDGFLPGGHCILGFKLGGLREMLIDDVDAECGHAPSYSTDPFSQ